MPETPWTEATLTPRLTQQRRRRRRLTIVALSLVGLLVLGGAAIAIVYRSAVGGIQRSEFALPGAADALADPGEQNILIMGMDSRVDQNGDPLPDGVYEALQAGGAEDGGYNANVLMLLHIPEDRSKAVGVSIPRDDYVEIPGAPMGVTHTKIKEAYGLAMQETMNELLWGEEELDDAERYQRARAAGRQAQIETVSHFLGDVRIDHFVEMTMGGFFHVTEAVAPVRVCLNHATEDRYSGAQFVAGEQDLDAEEAMSFVRQRRDTGVDGPYLTDLDRSRRQQAFLSSLTEKLRKKSTLTNPKTVWSLVDATQKHVALDSEFDVLGFLQIAHEVSQTGVQFLTLPILDFDTIDGASVNTVDVDQIQAIMAALLSGDTVSDALAAGSPEFPVAEDGDDVLPGEEVDTTEDAQSAPTADEAPAPTPTKPNATARYDSWDEPIAAGSIPCVN